MPRGVPKKKVVENLDYMDKAKQLIDVDRRGAYGPAKYDFACQAQMINALVCRRLVKLINNGQLDFEDYDTEEVELIQREPLITPELIPWIMTCVKAARSIESGKEDNPVDAIGYLALTEQL